MFFACSNSIQETKKPDIKIENEVNYFVEIKNAEIVKIDRENNRLFLTIEKEVLMDNSVIHEIICDIDFFYKMDSIFHISFFSDKKWANYKDELFNKENGKLSKDEYKNWMNDYYLGEFNYRDRTLFSYPVAESAKNKKKIKIGKCAKH